jgi:parallel beta-helix repeat protein
MKKTVVCCVVFVSLYSALGQGTLTPPGPPAPTMKSLNQVQPRTPILSLPITITSSGSYYLTTNLTGPSGTNGITIAASHVTVDLSGFTLTGLPGAMMGVNIPFSQTNIVIANGTIRGWNNLGVFANVSNARFEHLNFSDNGTALQATSGSGSVVLDCMAINNLNGFLAGDACTMERCSVTGSFSAISVGNGCTVKECTASANSLSAIKTGDSCVLDGCTAFNNSTNGIVAGAGCTLRNCTSGNNSGNGISVGGQCTVIGCSIQSNGVAGILTGDNCNVRDCNSSGNTGGVNAGKSCMISGCTVNSSLYYGISCDANCQVIGCTAIKNGTDGIYVSTNSTVSGCVASGNGLAIYARDGSTISGCTASGNLGDGIRGGNSLTVYGCTADYNGTNGVDSCGIGVAVRAFVSGCIADGNSGCGIIAFGDSVVTGNHASANGGGAGPDVRGGIIIYNGSGSRVEGNQVRDNIGYGIYASSLDIIMRNSANGNATNNFSPSSGVNFAPIQSPATATNPFANIVF